MSSHYIWSYFLFLTAFIFQGKQRILVFIPITEILMYIVLLFLTKNEWMAERKENPREMGEKPFV